MAKDKPARRPGLRTRDSLPHKIKVEEVDEPQTTPLPSIDKKRKNVSLFDEPLTTIEISQNDWLLDDPLQDSAPSSSQKVLQKVKKRKVSPPSAEVPLKSRTQMTSEEKVEAGNLMKQALDCLEEIKSCAFMDDLLEPIKNELMMVLTRIDPLDCEDLSSGVKEEKEQKSVVVEKLSLKDKFEDESDNEFKTEKDSSMDYVPGTNMKVIVSSSDANQKLIVFKCDVCGRTFTTEQGLQKHHRKDHVSRDELGVFCEYCGKTYPSSNLLRKHMQRHSDERKACLHCGKKVKPWSMNGHMRINHNSIWLAGKSGEEIVESKPKELDSLTTVNEYGIVFHECPFCLKRYRNTGKLFQAHVEKCKEIAEAPSVQGLDPPIVPENTYPCAACRIRFPSKALAAEHLTTEHRIYIRDIETFCFECREENADENHIHNPPRRYFRGDNACDLCRRRYQTKAGLDKHMKRHEDSEDRPFSCRVCSLKFKKVSNLNLHIMKVHRPKQEKKFVCAHCNKRFAEKFAMKVHIMYVHSKIEPFACSYCGMRFRHLKHMTEHCSEVHGKNPRKDSNFKCSYCMQAFERTADLKKHIEEDHD